jgi:hypothetical protein
MRILFSTTPALGHLFPLLPLARAARDNGHDVAVLTAQPLSSHLDADFEMLPAGPTVDVLLTEVKRRCGADLSDGTNSEPDPQFVAEFFAGTRVDLTFDQALAAAKVWRPDLIVYECCDFVGPLVATVLQCPATKLAYGPVHDAKWDDAMARRVAPRYDCPRFSSRSAPYSIIQLYYP